MKTIGPHWVSATPRPRTCALGVVCALLQAACAGVDAQTDFDAAAQLVQARTGQPQPLDPDASEEVLQAAVERMLADGLTVDESVRIALIRNPSLQVSYAQIGIRKAELVAAGLPRNPFVAVASRFPSGGGGATVSITLAQNIADLFLLPAKRKAGEARLSMARWQVGQDAVRLAGVVRAQSFDLLALQRGVAVADEGLKLAERSHAVAEHRLAAGLGDAVDVQLALSSVLDARRARELLLRDVAVGRAIFQQSLGLSTGQVAWSLVDTLPRSLAPPDVTDVESLVVVACDRRLDARVARLRVRAAEEALGIEHNSLFPNLVVGVSGETSPSSPTIVGPSVGSSIPLWSRNEPGIARSEFLLAAARHDLSRVLNSVARETREAAARVEASGRLVRLFEDDVLPGAQASVAISERAWQSGQREILVALKAQSFMLQQRTLYINALRDAAQARAALESAMGGAADGAGANAQATEQGREPKQ